MIAENSLLATSPWQTDMLGANFDLDEFDLNVAIDTCDFGSSDFLGTQSDCGSETSWADYEAINPGLFPDLGDDGSLLSSVPADDLLNVSFVNNLIAVNADTESYETLNFSDTDFSDFTNMDLDEEAFSNVTETPPSTRTPSPVTMSSPQWISTTKACTNSKRARSTSDTVDACEKRKWSEMEFLQKRRFIEDLSEFVKEKLELREQLEIIQIISPDRTISPTDTNFVIDLNVITDAKVEKINSLIHRHKRAHNNTTHNNVTLPTCKKGVGVATGGMGAVTCGVIERFDNNNEMSPRLSKRQKQEEARLLKERQNKKRRQNRKEKRSGLFRNEEVVSLSSRTTYDPGESDDIEIDV